MTLLFVDTNIPIYAAGKPHPLKAPSAQVLDFIAEHPYAFVTDAEVLQELLHRYRSLKLWPNPGLIVLQSFALVMHGRIESVGEMDVLDAARAADSSPNYRLAISCISLWRRGSVPPPSSRPTGTSKVCPVLNDWIPPLFLSGAGA